MEIIKGLNIKNGYGLAAATLLLLLVSYQLAFKKTILAWQQHQEMSSRLEQTTDLSYQPGYMERKERNLQAALGRYRVDTVAFRNLIINQIALIAEKENVRLKEVPDQDPFYHTDKLIIQKLVFEGDYFSLVRLLNSLQSAAGVGVVRSLILKLPARTSASEIRFPVLEIFLEAAK
jgi:hypothetical protein